MPNNKKYIHAEGDFNSQCVVELNGDMKVLIALFGAVVVSFIRKGVPPQVLSIAIEAAIKTEKELQEGEKSCPNNTSMS